MSQIVPQGPISADTRAILDALEQIRQAVERLTAAVSAPVELTEPAISPDHQVRHAEFVAAAQARYERTKHA